MDSSVHEVIELPRLHPQDERGELLATGRMGDGFLLVVRFALRDQAAVTAFDALCAEPLEGITRHEPGTLVTFLDARAGKPAR
ncbi:hypothetical protein [Streptomyces achromogenes]|uniref:hypothetical protein n=1 Tax=Streptomyces achromogenes TaxID=67255 RepID=UPI00370FB930